MKLLSIFDFLVTIKSAMQIFKFLVITLLTGVISIHVYAQNDPEEKRKMWVHANMNTKQDAVDFIKTAYKDFTVFIAKRSLETGIYKREVKFNDCELIIETEGREQESSWRSDRDFKKDIIVIDLDKVILDGNDIKQNGPENAKGLFEGRSYAHFHKIPAYSILSGTPNRDNDKFTDLHYEQHLQWAYQYLIEQCSAKK